ncbi:flavin reductase [Micromonospora sp. NBC_01796]|uniref:flavin reductase n=1 Tax=Micromonospora sp. NBC_01796 TaxID=2975987 RepID=UPI002DD9441A|nr:flavin reductase [Micromonospora sp. NBC_01796]WSA88612.1 flavin reductase [Micromonospora sp. NBC_01796]
MSSQPVLPVVTDQHRPCGKRWECGTCGKAWPCEPARARLTREYGHDRVSLACYLGTQLVHAARDIRDVGPRELYERFVSWTR